MKRRVILLAGKTHVLSLPKAWVQKHGVKKGDELELHEDGARLVIRKPLAEQRGRTIEINVSGTAPMIKRILGALYKAGYDEFAVQFQTAEELATIQEVVREEFIGFEIVHQGKHALTVKKISQIEPEEFDVVLRRMLHILQSMADDSRQALLRNDTHWREMIALRDKDINKLADFCRRILAQQLVPSRHAPMYHIVETLEKIGDAYRDLCKQGTISKALLDYYDRVNTFLREFTMLYYDFDLKKLTTFGTTYYTLVTQGNSLMPKLEQNELSALFSLMLIREHLFDMNGPLMAAKL